GRPLLAIGAGVAVLAVCAIPALELRQALPDDSTKPQDSTEYQSYKHLSTAFGPGFTGPLTTVIDFKDFKGSENPKDIADEAAKKLAEFPNVAAASQPVFN